MKYDKLRRGRVMMQQRRPLAITGVMWIIAVQAHAGPLPGVTFPSEPAYIANVEVVQDDPKAPAGFADLVRAQVLSEAALYGGSGQPVTLRIEVDKVHLKNAVQAMLIGDDNMTRGRVGVVDPATGALLGTFNVQVSADRRSHTGESIALMIAGALDPTGAVDIGSSVALASAGTKHSAAENGMSANFAYEALRRTFGDAMARAVHPAKH